MPDIEKNMAKRTCSLTLLQADLALNICDLLFFPKLINVPNPGFQ